MISDCIYSGLCVSAETLGERLLDSALACGHYLAEVMPSVGFRLDRLMDCKSYRAPVRYFPEPRHDVKSPVNRNRHYGQSELHSQHICAALEWTHMPVPCSGTLWKHHQRHASAQLPFGKFHSAARGRRRGVVDHDMPSDLTRIPGPSPVSSHRTDGPTSGGKNIRPTVQGPPLR